MYTHAFHVTNFNQRNLLSVIYLEQADNVNKITVKMDDPCL